MLEVETLLQQRNKILGWLLENIKVFPHIADFDAWVEAQNMGTGVLEEGREIDYWVYDLRYSGEIDVNEDTEWKKAMIEFKGNRLFGHIDNHEFDVNICEVGSLQRLVDEINERQPENS